MPSLHQRNQVRLILCPLTCKKTCFTITTRHAQTNAFNIPELHFLTNTINTAASAWSIDDGVIFYDGQVNISATQANKVHQYSSSHTSENIMTIKRNDKVITASPTSCSRYQHGL